LMKPDLAELLLNAREMKTNPCGRPDASTGFRDPARNSACVASYWPTVRPQKPQNAGPRTGHDRTAGLTVVLSGQMLSENFTLEGRIHSADCRASAVLCDFGEMARGLLGSRPKHRPRLPMRFESIKQDLVDWDVRPLRGAAT